MCSCNEAIRLSASWIVLDDNFGDKMTGTKNIFTYFSEILIFIVINANHDDTFI